MGFRCQFLLLAAAVVLSACSKLGDYSLTTTPTPTPVPSPSVTVTVPDPIHEWGFENNSNDSGSVGGWAGTLTGMTYDNTAGEFKVGSYAGKFSSGDSFDLGNQILPTTFSISCWVRWVSGSGNSATIIANSASGANANGFRLYVQTTGELVLETGTGTSGMSIASTSNLASATYTHVVAEFDGVLNQSAIYFNGALNQSGAVESGFNVTGDTLIGAMIGPTNSFNGELDDCRIYDVALSSDQVTILYNSY